MQGRRFCLFTMIMNTPLAVVNGLRWKTYIAGAIFSVPALFFWGVAVVLILPKVKTVLSASGHDASDVGWLSGNPLFLVAYGRFILIPILTLLVSLELFSRQWPRYRRAGVGLLVWLLNVAVLYGLTLLLLCVLLSASGLSGR
jgi:ABC-type amino acid transport system permease subunit